MTKKKSKRKKGFVSESQRKAVMAMLREKDIVKKVARNVRRSTERLQRRTQDYDECLGGACYTATTRLLKKLHAAGVKNAKAYYAAGHGFVVWRGNVVDVTATQFSDQQRRYPKVMIKSHKTLDNPRHKFNWPQSRSLVPSRIKVYSFEDIQRNPMKISNFLNRDQREWALERNRKRKKRIRKNK